MTTVKATLTDYLTSKGLWTDEAEDVVTALQAQPGNESLRFSDPAECYPPTMLAVLKLDARAEALNWIDENMPRHFARSMFEQGGA